MEQLFDFLDRSVSPYHAVDEAKKRLKDHGFVSLDENQPWSLEPKGRYFVTRNQSGILAFVLPEGKIDAYHMTASHSDSPTFRIKKNKQTGKYYARAEVEGYGGMIMSSWMDRPLGLAGRVLIRTEDGLESKLIAPDQDIFVIPNLAIHFNREINKGYRYNPQIDLQPVYGDSESDLTKYLLEKLGIEEEALVDFDLVLVVRQKAVTVGVDQEFYMAPRIDDLACAYTTLEGFLRGNESTVVDNKNKRPSIASFWCMFDNEEVGSGTRQGALGNFLVQTLERVESFCGMSQEERACARNRSIVLSADNAHATHPNLPEKSDSEFPVILNRGVVVKYNASQKYTTTGMTASIFEEICRRNEIIPVQHFVNRADAPGGSTLGNLLSHSFSVPMVDIGLAQLAMHSAVETAGCDDVHYMIEAIERFYESSIIQIEDGAWKW